MYGLMGIFAELERDMIRERTKAGLAAAKSRGRKGGRPAKLTGEQKTLAREMLADNRHSVGEVARVLRVGRATVYRALVRVEPGQEETRTVRVRVEESQPDAPRTVVVQTSSPLDEQDRPDSA